MVTVKLVRGIRFLISWKELAGFLDRLGMEWEGNTRVKVFILLFLFIFLFCFLVWATGATLSEIGRALPIKFSSTKALILMRICRAQFGICKCDMALSLLLSNISWANEWHLSPTFHCTGYSCILSHFCPTSTCPTCVWICGSVAAWLVLGVR